MSLRNLQVNGPSISLTTVISRSADGNLKYNLQYLLLIPLSSKLCKEFFPKTCTQVTEKAVGDLGEEEMKEASSAQLASFPPFSQKPGRKASPREG